MPSFDYAGSPIEYEPGDSVLDALARSGMHPTGGGTLCCGGDCPHCVAEVDGVAYVRTCQTAAAAGLSVEPHPASGDPALPPVREAEPTPIAYHHADVVVIGAGASGTQATEAAVSQRRSVLTFDAQRGEEVIAIYDGPLVVIRTPSGMIHVDCESIVVATGAAELQPACLGNDLEGLLTVRAAEHLVARGIDLGRCVSVGTAPVGIDCELAEGTLVRFEGSGRVNAVVTWTDGGERRYRCDTAIVGLGFNPRDGLARMGNGLPVTVVGQASEPSTIPPCPTDGTMCPCSNVTVDQLQQVWDRGFHEIELVKRATLAGTGTCQGMACMPYLRSFLADRGAELQPPFTARPLSRQITIGEMAAGVYDRTVPRTSLHDEHVALGAQMDRIGGWWRPWTYGDLEAEYRAVRERVSLGDVSTLGKMIVSGPDVEAMLQFIYPTDVSTIKTGRSRYVLMLNEKGYVFDDGLVSREHDGTFSLTFTSGGASHSEMWLRDWGARFDVRYLNQTMSLGAINVTGPRAKELLERAGLADPPPYMGHVEAEVAGVQCKVFRLSFTGELSFELHHPAERSVDLWRSLMELGAEYDIRPHGLEALQLLRLEKGHILVGADTDYDSTPRRIQHEWACKINKGHDFIGRQAVIRTNEITLDKQLVGIRTARAVGDGALLYADDQYCGYVTSTGYSPVLGHGVAMGWVYLDSDGQIPVHLVCESMPATIVDLPFYDAEGERARA